MIKFRVFGEAGTSRKNAQPKADFPFLIRSNFRQRRLAGQRQPSAR
jgi:hypothetical protein